MNEPHAIIRTSNGYSTAFIYNSLKEAKKYFSYMLHDNHSVSKYNAQTSAAEMTVLSNHVQGNALYYIANVVDTRNL